MSRKGEMRTMADHPVSTQRPACLLQTNLFNPFCSLAQTDNQKIQVTAAFPLLEHVHLRKAFSDSNPEAIIPSFTLLFWPPTPMGSAHGRMMDMSMDKEVGREEPVGRSRGSVITTKWERGNQIQPHKNHRTKLSGLLCTLRGSPFLSLECTFLSFC